MQTDYQIAGETIIARKRELAEAACAWQYERQPGVWEPYGEIGRQRAIEDAEYHLTFLAEALSAQHLPLFTQYVAWAKGLFTGLGLPDDALQMGLECQMDVLRTKLPSELSGPANEYNAAAIAHLSEYPNTPLPFVDETHSLGPLTKRYLDALLRGERHEANKLIIEAARSGVAIREIYEQVFERSQKEVGRLWQTNQLTVAQEHYCTASTQLIMSQFYPQLFATPRNGRRLVAACVSGELHEIGARMVTDFFELDGWDTYYLGANSPTHTIVQAVVDRKADVLAVSSTMTFHLRQVREIIAAVRASPSARSVKILVGGYPFSVVTGLWTEIGADGSGISASGAVDVGNQLAGSKH
ncbi:cobalamin B12-binding domain protein [candidate division BRC1 bacterium HGW-BRC1-1]|jgi:methanogenic corrinoid protein MtbC1|nr:MAG: cobalamin B12-binding domain protein [candidate division BRC1 bacterium HGW-BRC1-1]